MGAAFFSEEFQDSFVIETRLLGFFQPGGAKREQACEVFAGDGVIGQGRRGEEELGFGRRIQLAVHRQVRLLLKSPQGRARLRADRAVDGAGRDALTGERELRLENILHRSRSEGGFHRWSIRQRDGGGDPVGADWGGDGRAPRHLRRGDGCGHAVGGRVGGGCFRIHCFCRVPPNPARDPDGKDHQQPEKSAPRIWSRCSGGIFGQ